MSVRSQHDEEPDSRQFKRLKTCPPSSFSPEDYTIAWICALPLELEASRAMLDEEHPPLPNYPGDNNVYVLGHIGQHNVAMVCLPQYGKIKAAIVATNLHRSFGSIRATLMVGIGGGVPSGEHDIRLGDIVVGLRIMQHDMGKVVGGGSFERTGVLAYPSPLLFSMLSNLRGTADKGASSPQVTSILQARLPTHIRPDSSHPDRLFQASYEHPSGRPTCDQCDPSKLEMRRVRASNDPSIHYGVIASGDTVMKDAKTRDDIARELSVLCFEMEAAGITDNQCLPIRGICDYSDSHKNKAWQDYAAATAAAYAREFLERLPPTHKEPARARTSFGTASAHEVCVNPTSERRQQFLESLSFPQLNTRMANVQRAHLQTCRWFLRHPKYQDWLDPRKHLQTRGFLWIVGKAGAGKSTIMKFAYLETKKKFKEPGKPVASFFFNARGDILERSVAGMYRSLLLQLLRKYPDLQAILDDTDIVPPNQTRCPDLNVLKEAFRGAVLELKERSFTCLVDALDECDEQEVREMVQFFEELAEATTADGIQFRACFSSRPYPYIHIRPEVLLILEKEDGHAEDLSRYVTSHLRISNSSMLPVLKDRILEKAAGIFMWIVLVVDILNKENEDGALALGKKLEEIPSKLSDLFKSILTRDRHQADRLRLCLLWVLCAMRPLTPAELRHALWASLRAHDLVDAALPENTAVDAAKLVTSSSKGLAEITESKPPIVQFIHESVRDFLLKEHGLRDLWPDLGLEWEANAHEKLKHSCLTYLSLPGVQHILERVEEANKQEKKCSVPTGTYPFLKYASQMALAHADAAAIAIPQDAFISEFFSSAGIRWINTKQAYCRDTTPLYILADMGLAKLVRSQMKKESATRTRERYEQPFFAALARGHDGAAAALMGLPSTFHNGVRKELQGYSKQLEWSMFAGRTSLSWAAQEGNLGLVKTMIEAGEDINEIDGGGRIPLERAMANRHFDVAWFLVDSKTVYKENSWDPPLPEGRGLLMIAAQTGSEARVRNLVEGGADVHARDFNGNTALNFASQAGSETVAQILIDNNANVRAQNRFMETALHVASHAGRVGVARLLIDNGARLDVVSYGGKTALMYAAGAGSEGVARLLLERGADIDASSNAGYTALVYATIAGSEAVARLLLDRGADVNLHSQKGTTALIFASMAGNKAMAKLLIDEGGADVEAPDLDGQTALMWASRAGNEGLVNLLIEKGTANVDASADDRRKTDSGF